MEKGRRGRGRGPGGVPARFGLKQAWHGEVRGGVKAGAGEVGKQRIGEAKLVDDSCGDAVGSRGGDGAAARWQRRERKLFLSAGLWQRIRVKSCRGAHGSGRKVGAGWENGRCRSELVSAGISGAGAVAVLAGAGCVASGQFQTGVGSTQLN
jgi:hypothetical protein